MSLAELRIELPSGFLGHPASLFTSLGWWSKNLNCSGIHLSPARRGQWEIQQALAGAVSVGRVGKG